VEGVNDRGVGGRDVEAGGRRRGALGGTGEEVRVCAPCHHHHTAVFGLVLTLHGGQYRPMPYGRAFSGSVW
jgi:hypothetical protein